jgi:RNA polymerase sigma-70 factor (ECF subfamily)
MERPDEPTPLERTIRGCVDAGDVRGAATAAIEGYGPELLGYLYALAKDDADAQDLFADLCERMWRKLPEFRWQSSFRTWAYTIARNLLRDSHRDERRRRAREVAISDAPEIAQAAEAVRSTTLMYLRSEAKRRLEDLRAALDDEDRTLLILRVDRRMTWRDIAQVMADGMVDEGELVRTAAKLRKRFERIKERLREYMREQSS